MGGMRTKGRPLTYTPEVAALICERLAEGESLRAICRDAGMPPESTVRGWVLDNVQDFAAQYARARDIGLDAMAEEILEIADTPVEGVRREEGNDGYREIREDMLGHRRLQVDTRKWLLSKMAPKRYGDRTAMELTGANGGPVQISDADRAARVAGLLALAEQRKGDADVDDLV
jgi:hypothetical protein